MLLGNFLFKENFLSLGESIVIYEKSSRSPCSQCPWLKSLCGVLGGAAGLGGVVGCMWSSSPLSIFNMFFIPPLGIDHLLCAYFSYPFSWVARPHRLGPIFLITAFFIDFGPIVST